MPVIEFYKRNILWSKSETGKHHYEQQLHKLRQFRRYVTLGDVTENFVIEYYNYMIKELQNKETTADKSLIVLKSIINKAIAMEYIEQNPFQKIHIRMPKKKPAKYIDVHINHK